MDKALKNKEIVKSIQAEVYQHNAQNSDATIQQFRIVDDENGQYLLYMDGWREENHTYGCFFHIHVAVDGKVWLFRDGTDLEIGQMLLDKGINPDELVLAWIAPIRRADTGYAIA